MDIEIRTAVFEDIPALEAVSEKMADPAAAGYFAECLKRQQAGERLLYLAQRGDTVAGYVMLVWRPRYAPFRNAGIPEVQDLSVTPDYRRQGIAGLLMGACEARAREAGCPMIGLGVGLHGRFGAAQQLYVRRGYVPDGAGVAYDARTMAFGEMRPLDDHFTLKFIRVL